MADYINPFSMYQNVNSVPNNPFASGWYGADFQQKAMPFMNNSLQSSNLDLQRKAMETGEFIGQEAQRQRSVARQADIAKNQSFMRMQPLEEGLRRDEIAQRRRALPDLTDAEIEKARTTVMNAKSQPQRELIAEIGALHDILQSAGSDTERAFLYQNAIARWEQTHPGHRIPEQYRFYRPGQTDREIAAIRAASVNTPELAGKERLAHIQGGYAIEQEGMQQEGANRRAEIAAGATRYSADRQVERAAAAETPQKAMARLRRELSSKEKYNLEKLEEYRMYVDDQWDKVRRDDIEVISLQSQMASPDEKVREQAIKRYQRKRHEYFAEKGIYLNAPPDGTVRRHPKRGLIRYKAGYGSNPLDLKNWEDVKEGK